MQYPSPLRHFYQTDPVFDANNKLYEEQGVVKLAFIDAQLIRNVLEPLRSKFTEEERKRDEVTDDLSFVHSP